MRVTNGNRVFLNKFCRILAGSALLVVIGLFGSAYAGPSISATDEDSLQTDLNSDGKVNRGDTIRHTITIRNTGDTDAVGVGFSDTMDSGTTLTGSFRTTPVAVDDSYSIDEDETLTIEIPGVLGNDIDPDSDTLGASVLSGPSHGSLSMNSDGSFTYTPDTDYNGTDSFTYIATDTIPASDSATVILTINSVDDPPVAVADASTVVEDSSANTINVLTNDTDIDSGPISIQSVTQPVNGSVVITNGGADLTYTPNANYCNNPPGTTLDTFSYTLNGGSTATVKMKVTCVDDPPVAVADAVTVDEDSVSNTIDVRANDTDIDGGPKTITSASDPANGTVAITNGGADLTYTPNLNYCNDGSPLDTFTYTLNGGSSATVSVTVTCVNDPPVADNDTFDFIGNTELRVDTDNTGVTTAFAGGTTTNASGVLDNDADPVENDPISVVGIVDCADDTAPFDCSMAGVGRVLMESDGKFSFVPQPGDTDASEDFQYKLSDGTDTVTGTVTLNRSERVWYVKNDTATAGTAGTSVDPFDTLSEAEAASLVNDYIFIYFGDGTSTGQDAGISLKNGQRLLGEHVGLSIPVDLNSNGDPTALVAAVPGNRPVIGDTVIGGPEGVSAIDAVPAEIAGLSLSGNVNAIEWTTNAAFAGTGTLTIRDNIITGAGAIGVDINLTGTGATRLAFHDNNLTASGTALNVQETGSGALTITALDDNVVSGNTGGSGIIVNNAIFDSVPGGGFDTVDGDTTVIGALGNPVGGAGLSLATVQGNLFFDDLDVYAGTSGLTLSGGGGGMTFAVAPASPNGSGTSVIRADNGAAVNASNATIDLRLDDMDSTTTGVGVSLSGVGGKFSTDTDASINKTSGGGTAFSVANSVSGTTVSYAGTLNVTSGSGSGVALTTNTGSTISFTGGMTLSTGANAAFTATGGGTVTVTDPPGLANNTITTSSGTALKVTDTNIGASGLTFEKISAGSSGTLVNGIVLNNTGTSGGLSVTGTGGTCTSSATCTGGTIQNTTGDGISLINTRNVSLRYMNITNNKGSGIYGDDVTNFSLISSSVTNNADTATGTEAGLRFIELLGTCAITNSTISGSYEDNIRMTPASGVLNLEISGSSIGPNVANSGNNGLTMLASGSAAVTLTVTNTTFTGNRASSFYFNLNGDSKGTANISSSTFQDSGSAVHLGTNNNADLNFDITGNTTIERHRGAAIQLVAASAGTASSQIQGTISGNNIGNGSAGSGSDLMYGIALDLRGAQDAIIKVDNNDIRNTNLNGIFATAAGPCTSGNGRLDLTLINNSVGQPDNDSSPVPSVYGVLVEAAKSSTVCLDISGNTSASAGGVEKFSVRQSDTSTFYLERLTDGDATSNEIINNIVTVEAFVSGANDAGSTADATLVNGFTEAANGFCREP